MDFFEFLKIHKNRVKKLLKIDDLENRVSLLEKELNDLNAHIKDENNYFEMQHKIKELEKDIFTLRKEKEMLQKECRELEIENRNLKERLQTLLDSYKQSPLRRLKELYNSLNPTTKEGLKNIFKSEDELALFVAGIREIEAIWDYAAYLRREHIDGEFEKVRDIFYLLFDVYRKITNADYQQVKVGDIFDFKLHIRDNRSKSMSGRVEEVVFYGYVENGIIIKKSIVKVK